MGVPNPGSYKEILNSDDKKYGGTGVTNGTEMCIRDRFYSSVLAGADNKKRLIRPKIGQISLVV